MTAATADDLKAQGNKAFSSGDYQSAIDLFSRAIELDNNNHVLYSNRSAAYSSLKNYDAALEDADKAIKSKPDWAKVRVIEFIYVPFPYYMHAQGYGRKGAALYGLQRLTEAEKAYSDGLKLEPDNGTLRKGLEDVRSHQAAPMGMGGDPFATMFQGDFLAKLAANPKVSSYLADPEFMQKLQLVKQNPQLFAQYVF
jgi:stress-induced-phosphoprotein 1